MIQLITPDDESLTSKQRLLWQTFVDSLETGSSVE